ncbi:YciI family protein [Neobacillus sp. D3-1R]|uniref:YciI family protein n=1 Tax=Neobacillus sp. D3-1R TaxID=3445778 RepID=UPI003FA01F6E
MSETTVFVIFLTMNPGRSFSEELVHKHVAFLKELDDNGQLVLCGPFTDYDGGMIVIRAESFDEAEKMAQSDPFVSSMTESYKIRTWKMANRDNNYLLSY